MQGKDSRAKRTQQGATIIMTPREALDEMVQNHQERQAAIRAGHYRILSDNQIMIGIPERRLA